MKIIKRMHTFTAALVLLAGAVLPQAHAGVAERVQRATVGSVDVVVYPMDVKDVVTVMGVMPLGDAAVASRAINPALPNLTAMLVQQGTTAHDKYQIADTLSALGAEMSIDAGDTELRIRGKSLAHDMPTVLGLLVEQLRTPAFAESEFQQARAQFGAMLQQVGDNPDARAYQTLLGSLFPATSPNAAVPLETLQKAVATVTLEQIKAFHARYFGPDHMILVFTGDVSLAQARAAVTKAFAGWHGGVDFVRDAAGTPVRAAARVAVPMQDKASVSVMWGQPTGLDHAAADYLPLSLGVDVLGSGFTGRLMSSVRDQEGLTYGIGANLFGDDVVSGGFMMQATFAPELLGKGIASSERELQRWWRDGITARELAARKQSLSGAWQLQMGTTGGMAHTLLSTLVRGQDLAWIDRYPQALHALTLEQVNQAIRSHLDPATLLRVEAGSLPKS